MKHIKSVNEYYKGKNQTVGFRYSEPELDSKLNCLIFVDDNYDYETNIKKIFDELLDDYEISFEDKTNEEDGDFFNNIKNEIESNLPFKIDESDKMIELIIKLTTYDEDEILSLSIEFISKGENDFLVYPNIILNGSPFDIGTKHRSKKQMGY